MGRRWRHGSASAGIRYAQRSGHRANATGCSGAACSQRPSQRTGRLSVGFTATRLYACRGSLFRHRWAGGSLRRTAGKFRTERPENQATRNRDRSAAGDLSRHRAVFCGSAGGCRTEPGHSDVRRARRSGSLADQAHLCQRHRAGSDGGAQGAGLARTDRVRNHRCHPPPCHVAGGCAVIARPPDERRRSAWFCIGHRRAAGAQRGHHPARVA